MIYVYTSIVNGWDNLRPPLAPTADGVRYICFTDCPILPRVSPWEFRPLYNMGTPGATARLPKILPHLLLPPDAEYSIYHDGNFQLTAHPAELIRAALTNRDWAAHAHPARSCIYAEAEELLRSKIGDPSVVQEETAFYRAACYPANNGLWANGFLVRRHTGRVKKVCESWWELFRAGCGRDQVSFPVAREAERLDVCSLPGDIYTSPYVHFNWHAAWLDKESSVPFHSERAVIRGQLDRLRKLAGHDVFRQERIPAYPAY